MIQKLTVLSFLLVSSKNSNNDQEVDRVLLSFPFWSAVKTLIMIKKLTGFCFLFLLVSSKTHNYNDKEVDRVLLSFPFGQQ